MDGKNMPKRRTKYIATGISHCTEEIIDLSLKLAVSTFFYFFFFNWREVYGL